MRTKLTGQLVAGVLLAWLVAAATASVAHGQASPPLAQCATTRWVGAWTADPSGVLGVGYVDQTLRVVLTPHIGGAQLRVHISNRLSSSPLSFARAGVARRESGAAIVAGSSRPLTFGGNPGATVPAGGEITSDPAALTFDAFQDLAVSLYLADANGPAASHLIGRERSYVTSQSSGDHTSDTGADAFTGSTTSVPYVDAVDARAPSDVGAAVLFGDSITDGYVSAGASGGEDQGSIDGNRRLPDDLQRRLDAATGGGPRLSVLNAGISGNRVLADGQGGGGGPSGVSRIDPDVTGVAGVTDAIVLEGINDIALAATADQVTGALGQIVTRLRAQGLHVLIGTLLPAGTGLLNLGTLLPGFYVDSPANAVRVAVNGWIRSGASGADGVIDFDAALKGRANPNELDPAYDSGDHLHPSDAGYRRMADAVDLAGLRGARCAPPVATRLLVRAGVPSTRHLRVRGSLITAAPADCTGAHVTLRALHGGHTLFKRAIRLTAACHFTTTRALTAGGRIEVRVGFAGSPTLLATPHRSVVVRA